MTAAMPMPAHEDWTADDLDHLPERYRYEIVDGTLHMTPSPLPGHQQLSVALLLALRRQLPEGWTATVDVDVILSADGRNVRRPDVVVYRLGDPERRLTASEVRLVAEVVSAGSRTEDRVTKPAVYAAAGIAHYWRVETKPELTVVEYRLTELGRYYEHSPRAGIVTVDHPWPIEIDLGSVAREAGLA